MNKITMTLQADQLILEALKEDISSEDVTTNSVMKEAVAGEVDLICKQDGIIAGLEVFERVFQLLDETVEVEFYCKDGDKVSNGQMMGRGEKAAGQRAVRYFAHAGRRRQGYHGHLSGYAAFV